MTEDRLLEKIKDRLYNVSPFLSEAFIIEIEWLIAEVERLQHESAEFRKKIYRPIEAGEN